ncbi:MAG TPA: flavoprotein, partial [Gemmatimonadales bacterium]|nr:flavoprotein [Gemmatimonadales bacterium]
MWAGRHVVLGVSGGIACYKSCILARRLTEAGARVDVVLTRAAAEFVRPLTFEALTGRPVLSSLWERDRALAHVRLAESADLLILAPATAQLL